MERGAWDPPEASRRPWTHTGMWSVLPLNCVRTSGKLLIAGLTWKCLRDQLYMAGAHQTPVPDPKFFMHAHTNCCLVG